MRLYVDGKGRARRAEYGWFVLFCVVVGVVTSVIDTVLNGGNPYATPFVTILAGLALIAPTVSGAARRAHDFGQSGWLAALVCVPYIGGLAALVFVFIPGQPAPNQYGPDPKAP